MRPGVTVATSSPQRRYQSAITRGDESVDTNARLLETARYVAGAAATVAVRGRQVGRDCRRRRRFAGSQVSAAAGISTGSACLAAE